MIDKPEIDDLHIIYVIELWAAGLGSLLIPGFFLCAVVLGFFVWLIWSNVEFD